VINIIMVRVGEDQEILTLSQSLRFSLRSITRNKGASLRSRAIVSQERISV